MTPGSGFTYYVVSDQVIFDEAKEALCPAGKIAMPLHDEYTREGDAFADAVGRAWDRFAPNGRGPGFAIFPQNPSIHIRKILAPNLSQQEVCAYHLARAIAAAFVELGTGFAGSDYERVMPFANMVIEELGSDKASPEWLRDAQDWVRAFLIASRDDGTTGFLATWEASQRE